jgi:GT2 family glycosyltransferase
VGGVLSKFWMPSHRFQGQHLAQLELPDRITDVVYFPNAWMLRRSLVDLGFKYDTDLFPHNWAEQDTGQQVLRLGYKLATICKAVTWHDLGYQRKLTRVSQQTIYDQARSRILFRRKYRASLPVWVVFWTAIFPLSTFYYLRSALQQKSPFTLAVLYLKGTWTGTFQSINK